MSTELYIVRIQLIGDSQTCCSETSEVSAIVSAFGLNLLKFIDVHIFNFMYSKFSKIRCEIVSFYKVSSYNIPEFNIVC